MLIKCLRCNDVLDTEDFVLDLKKISPYWAECSCKDAAYSVHQDTLEIKTIWGPCKVLTNTMEEYRLAGLAGRSPDIEVCPPQKDDDTMTTERVPYVKCTICKKEYKVFSQVIVAGGDQYGECQCREVRWATKGGKLSWIAGRYLLIDGADLFADDTKFSDPRERFSKEDAGAFALVASTPRRIPVEDDEYDYYKGPSGGAGYYPTTGYYGGSSGSTYGHPKSKTCEAPRAKKVEELDAVLNS